MLGPAHSFGSDSLCQPSKLFRVLKSSIAGNSEELRRIFSQSFTQPAHGRPRRRNSTTRPVTADPERIYVREYLQTFAKPLAANSHGKRQTLQRETEPTLNYVKAPLNIHCKATVLKYRITRPQQRTHNLKSMWKPVKNRPQAVVTETRDFACEVCESSSTTRTTPLYERA